MDWQDLGPGPELDRAVAERKGWKIRQIVPGRQVRYQLIRPDGSIEGVYNAERDAWLQVPSYSVELLSALKLTDVPGTSLALHKAAQGGWWAEVGTADGDPYASGPDGHLLPNPASAIVRAWLAAQDAVQKSAPES